MMIVIVNCGPCQEFIAKCLFSILSQTITEWQAYVTVDPYGDRTLDEAMHARRGDPRINILQNRERRFAMVNLKSAVERSGAHPDDVIVVLDGDDWFATPDALKIIDDTYLTVAPKNGAIMAGRKGPAKWLRDGPLPAQRLQLCSRGVV
jgi:glycosyltransferase involved in cell wall biosynthesis